MKKLWLFLSLLICSTLVAGCTNQQPQQKNFDFVSDCKNLVQDEFWDTEYGFSGDINYHSGVYFDYSIVTGSIYFNYKTRPFLCLYEWNDIHWMAYNFTFFLRTLESVRVLNK